ncbi:hypothetical protein E3U24_02110 [Paracoccus pantotrophus]|uniref:hypothetical protein n=1 Tax=Paracoccus pantotrophus TaxID=82367 RepID=UPI0011C070EA|nr:hypothetical protein [Paracoccus pantotrophus]WGR64163.1 hypothetical protein E3U24_02110 [Paracoccus pantotrophus]
MWTFFKSIRTVRDISFDAAAKLMRVDCRERTLQSQRVELFLEDRQVAGETGAEPIETPEAGTFHYFVMMDICVPSQRVALDAPFRRCCRTPFSEGFTLRIQWAKGRV